MVANAVATGSSLVYFKAIRTAGNGFKDPARGSSFRTGSCNHYEDNPGEIGNRHGSDDVQGRLNLPWVAAVKAQDDGHVTCWRN